MNFSLKLTYHEVYLYLVQHSVKGSLICDQTIEVILIFSSAFSVELKGVAQLTWWAGGSTYPTLPYRPVYTQPALCSHERHV